MKYLGRVLSPASGRWGLLVLLFAGVVIVAAAGWAEWRRSAALLASLPSLEEAVRIGGASPAAAVRELDALAKVTAVVSAGDRRSPLGLLESFGRFGPTAEAQGRYAAAVDRLLPGPVGEALATTFATEGGSVRLYDALRTLEILQGDAPWEPAFLAGWLADRAAVDPVSGGLARHAAVLSAPPTGFDAPDADLLGQARAIAAESDPAALAYVELARDPRIQALPGWSPAEVPDLASVLVRRSGRPIESPLPGLFTATGWAAARSGPAQAAVERAAAASRRLFGRSARAPAEEMALLAELQRRTLDAWSSELADLRVRPFARQPDALLTSRTLAGSGSLEALFRAAWREAGGDDLTRSPVDRIRIATALGPTAHFVEGGGMAEIARLFADLERVVSALGPDADVTRRPLMDARARAAVIALLDTAPRPVAGTVEDVLAQTTASQSGLRKPRAALIWQRDLAGACRFALADRYPFVNGPDADFALVAAFLAPDGTLARFRSGELAPLLDTRSVPWRWKPEALLSGMAPESATFFGQAVVAGEALFPGGDGVDLTLTALDPPAAATASLGGATVPIAGSEEPWTLSWPGPHPEDGFGIAIATGSGVERKTWPGPWGLLRFLDEIGLRARDGGQRYLLDVRLGTSRAGIELAFASTSNPVAARQAISGLACPPTL